MPKSDSHDTQTSRALRIDASREGATIALQWPSEGAPANLEFLEHRASRMPPRERIEAAHTTHYDVG